MGGTLGWAFGAVHHDRDDNDNNDDHNDSSVTVSAALLPKAAPPKNNDTHAVRVNGFLLCNATVWSLRDTRTKSEV